MKIEPCADLKGFFRAAVDSALTRRRLSARPETGDYVAGVLVQAATQPPETLLGEPLVIALDRALAGDPSQRLHRLCTTGDAALCLAGIFGSHVERTQGSLALYVKVGGIAYQKAAEVAAEVAETETATVPVLAELSEAFPRFVDVLQEVAAASALGGLARDVVRLYDRTKHAGSARAAEELARQGLFTAPGATKPC